jgi:Flp pilus assembly pilin Flp
LIEIEADASGKEVENPMQILEMIIKRFDREDGQALAEYGLILALIAIFCLIALGALGAAVSGILDDVAAAL